MWALLLLPFIGLLWLPFYNSPLPELFGFPFFYWYQLLWVPFYNFAEPSLFGFPFFYWYQFAWVPITSVLIWIVYRSGYEEGDE